MSPWVFIAIAVVVLIAWEIIFGGHVPAAFRDRGCCGKDWIRAFPGAPTREIRGFISLFACAFVFRARDKLKFGPNDTLLGIYRAIYPSKWTPDAMELEAFAVELLKRYGVDLRAMWQDDLTLGHVFAETRRRGSLLR
jgi:propanediol dehydratase small subunit